jgi:4-amino-4-deoxy-L-arabinose transferase-like glycosyltransferase
MVSRLSQQAINYAGRRPIIGIMLLSLAVKLILICFDQVINPDGVLYIAAARQIAVGNMGEAIELYPMPAYPLLITAMHFIIPNWIAAARVIGIASLVLASIPLFGITRILFNQQAAIWAGICLALTPEANELAMRVIRDPIFLLTALTAILFFLKGIREQSLKNIFFALLMTGVSFLFRVEGIIFLLVPALFLGIKATLTIDVELKRFARRGLLLWIGVLLTFGGILALAFGPQLLSHNKIEWVISKVTKITDLTAFDNYQAISRFFKAIETDPPFSGLSKSLPAIVRHWMPLIYLIGLLEYFVKQIFPIFLLPLLFVIQRFFSNRPSRILIEKQIVLFIWVVYMALILCSFIIRDYIQGRFLFTPAILLYPWLGHGITLILQWLKGIRFAHILQVALILLIIIAPTVKSVQPAIQSDPNAIEVGRFISEDKSFSDAKVLFSDTRLWLYGKGTGSFQNAKQTARSISRNLENGNVKAIENQALRVKADVLVLSINFDKTKTTPEFDRYGIYRQFPSRKCVTIIYKVKKTLES